MQCSGLVGVQCSGCSAVKFNGVVGFVLLMTVVVQCSGDAVW